MASKSFSTAPILLKHFSRRVFVSSICSLYMYFFTWSECVGCALRSEVDTCQTSDVIELSPELNGVIPLRLQMVQFGMHHCSPRNMHSENSKGKGTADLLLLKLNLSWGAGGGGGCSWQKDRLKIFLTNQNETFTTQNCCVFIRNCSKLLQSVAFLSFHKILKSDWQVLSLNPSATRHGARNCKTFSLSVPQKVLEKFRTWKRCTGRIQ